MGHVGHFPLEPQRLTTPVGCGAPRKIGVHDYDSLTKLLQNTWKRLYDSPARDPQDIIQHMEAEIMRRRQADSEATR
jgi:hypothetical protein